MPGDSNDSNTEKGRGGARALLLAGGTLPRTEAARESLRVALAGPIDWAWLLRRGAAHRILPLVQHALSGLPASELDAVPRRAQQALALAQVEAKAAIERQRVLLGSLLDELTGRGVDALVVKGLALAALYPATELRPALDIDLLVRERDWPAIAQAFERLGLAIRPTVATAPTLTAAQVLHLASYVSQVAYESPCGTPVEVHFRLLNVGVPVKFEDAWERARSMRVGDLEVPTVSAADALVYHAMHANKHGFSRLIWFVDFRLMLLAGANELDWDGIIRRCRELGVGRSLAYMVDLTMELFGSVRAVPAATDIVPAGSQGWRSFCRRWPREPILSLDAEASEGLGQWYYLREVASWRQRVRYVTARLWPPRWCLGTESRWSYLRRRTADASPRLARMFRLTPTEKAFGGGH